ncbi:MAG: hypothetical protein J6I61_10280 [Prevotella sp.]|nr:hypothetical protein [Prevotella sp.]
MNNYIINGGSHSIPHDVENLIAHGGVYYIRGNIGSLTLHGGIVYDQRPSNRVEYRTEKITEEERRKYENKIDTLEIKLANSNHEILQLRNNLSELQAKEDEQTPSDDVLVRRIITLQNELEAEKAAHRKEVEELQYRLDGALEVNAKLRMGIKDTDHRSEEIADKHIDILATLMSLYPFTPDGDLEMEFGLPRNKIKYVAQVLGGVKSKEARQEAVEYLAKQDRELIQRRGGAQPNHFTKPVEQVAKNGRVINTFVSTTEAMEATGYDQTTVRKYCQRFNNRKERIYTKEGFTFRYKV